MTVDLGTNDDQWSEQDLGGNVRLMKVKIGDIVGVVVGPNAEDRFTGVLFRATKDRLNAGGDSIVMQPSYTEHMAKLRIRSMMARIFNDGWDSVEGRI